MAIPLELQGVAIGMGGAALGYAFREYRNRVRPFFQITEIDGTITKRTDRAEVSAETVDRLSDTFFLKGVEKTTDLGTLSDCHNNIRRMIKWWPQDKPAVEQVLAAADDASMCSALATAFGWASIDNWLTRFLVSDRISLKPIPTGLTEKVPVHEDSEVGDGSVWFLFPKNGKNFGNHFKNRAVRAKCDPMIQAIRFLHLDTIKDAFSQFATIVEKEYQKAMECQTEVKDKVDEKSRWCFYCYMANLSSSPIVIEKDAYIHVRDRTKVNYKEECYLLVIRRDDKGNRVLQDTNTPLVVKQGEDSEFAFITKSAQSGMELGKALREAFDRAQGQCHLTVVLRRVGFFKRQRYRSASSRFAGAVKDDGTKE